MATGFGVSKRMISLSIYSRKSPTVNLKENDISN